ncbi:SAM-dependent methyltransferase [Sorangium cellulosum]|uniref:SAM-dependent methyltransferase n=1 Tax=Sorangium cellulosum TaxID=56 RepID=A0A150TNQ5_SORCE|nr:SAM-dependent methyltransferase [Sorangium cellulosum]
MSCGLPRNLDADADVDADATLPAITVPPAAQAYRRGSLWQKGRGERLIELAGVRRGELVLDLGCGTGGLTQQLAELVGPGGRVVGIDPDEARIALALETAVAPNLEFQVGTAETLGEIARGRPVDLVFSNFVFHWIRDKRAVLRRLRGLLHPAGRIVVQCVSSLPVLVGELSRLADPSGERILRDFAFEDAAAIAHHVEGAGLQLIRLEEQQGTHVYPTLDALLTWWRATTHDRFDPRAIEPAALARFAEQHNEGGAFLVHETFCWFEARIPPAHAWGRRG